jgi:hypothetical protein
LPRSPVEIIWREVRREVSRSRPQHIIQMLHRYHISLLDGVFGPLNILEVIDEVEIIIAPSMGVSLIVIGSFLIFVGLINEILNLFHFI